MDTLGVYQSPDTVKSILEEDDLERIWREYETLDGIVLEAPNLSDRMTSSQENRIPLYDTALKVDIRLPIFEVLIELLRWYRFVLPNSPPMPSG